MIPRLSAVFVLVGFFLPRCARSAELDATPPEVSTLRPAANSTVREFTQLEVSFTEAVNGVSAADLLINGSPASNVYSVAPGQYVFEFSQPSAGSVILGWARDHGITDLAESPNPLVTDGSWLIALEPTHPKTGIIISEFLAVNNSGLRDEDGDASDWIELWNTNTVTVSLGGWFLTDDAAKLSKWRFPEITMEPNSYLVVFASGKNRTNSFNRLHTDFQLSSRGEFLALVNSETNIVSSFAPTYPQQQTDVSFGRDRLSTELVGPLKPPTPGAPNTSAGEGFAPEVTFSTEGGTFVHPFNLHLTTSDPDAEIRYVLVLGSTASGNTNGATSDSFRYTGPIPITTSTQVRVRTFKPGYLPGPPRSESYIQLDPSALDFSSDLPIVLIDNFGQGVIPTSGDQPAVMAVFEKDRETGRATLTSRPSVMSRIGLNVRGRGSQGYAKSSFAVEFWDEFNQDKDLEILGMPAESDWVLYGTLDTDPVLIHNPLAREMSNILGRQASRTRFVEVFVNTALGPIRYVNPTIGNYNGIYVIMEKIKQGPGRVNIASLQPEDTASNTVSGGYIFKSDDPVESDEYSFLGARQEIIMVYPGKRAILQPQRAPQLKYLREFYAGLSNSLFGVNWTNQVPGYSRFIDTDSWIDHLLVCVTTFNVDAIRLSGYFYKGRDKPLEMGPVWDYDRSLGSTDGRQFDPRRWRGTDGDGGTDYFNPPGPGPAHYWYGQLCRDIEFWQRYIDRYQSIRQGPYSISNLYGIIDRMIGELVQAQPRELAKWGALAPPRNINGLGQGTFATEVIWLKRWLSNRLDFMDTNFLARPQFSLQSGTVAAGTSLALVGPSKTNSEVYYTLDGTDPRARLGGLSSNAFLYKDSLTISTNTRIIARSFNGTHRNSTGANNPPLSSRWSGPISGTFVVNMPPLIVTEIMYHPDKVGSGDSLDAERYEYLELKNRGPSTIDLTGFRLTNGIAFLFSATNAITHLGPGEYAIIVKDLDAFRSRYPEVTNIVGEYTGNLSNDGNRITVLGPVGEEILDFRYQDQWAILTDGAGFSLVASNEDAPLDRWNTSAQWRASSRWRGSPGSSDPTPNSPAQVLVNEVLSYSENFLEDAVELFNPSQVAVNIGGWFLTDDFSNPTKYRIPSGTTISPGGYAVLREKQFNDPTLPNRFAFSRLGDEVFLFSGDGTNPTGYFHGFHFGSAQADVSFGRHVASTGQEQFVAQASRTFGQANAGPRIGPVVIQEVSYNPRTVLAGSNIIENIHGEYIVVSNLTDTAAPLFEAKSPGNTWIFQGGVEFAFPPNVVLDAHTALFVVGFDPKLDGSALEHFRLLIGVETPTRVLGPFRGHLGNEHDTIQLLKPSAPVLPPSPDAGLIPYVVVDRVGYSSSAPWPSIGSEHSGAIRRISPNAYGDDPSNWEVVVRPRPSIVQPPWSQNVRIGSNATFTVVAKGSGAFSYRWRKDGVDILGQTGSSLTISNVQFGDRGWYDVLVTDSTGSVLSPNAALSPLTPPLLVQQPEGVISPIGVPLKLTVSVTNTASLPLVYRWRRGSSVVNTVQSFSHSATYEVGRIQAANAGSYSVSVSNAALAGSSPILSRSVPVVTFVPPSNVVANIGDTATIRSTISPGPSNSVSLQWFFSGKPLTSETNMTLTLSNLKESDQGIYTLWLTNFLNGKAFWNAGLGLTTPIVLSEPNLKVDGTFGFLFQGIPYQNYQIQLSTNVSSPTNWVVVSSFPYTIGQTKVIDTTLTNNSTRFYKAVLKP